MQAERPLAADDHDRIVAAVHDEVARWGIDRFDVGAMAHRHGLDEPSIRRHWPDPEALLLHALALRPGDDGSLPDTGSLRADLIALAQRMVALATSEEGRKLHGGHLIADTFVASMDVRRSAWRARAASVAEVFERARERGELRADVDHITALEMLFAPINMRALYTGEDIDNAYCEQIADMVYRAVSA